MIQQLWREFKRAGVEGNTVFMRQINGSPIAQTLARNAFYAGAEAMRDSMNTEVRDLQDMIEDEQEQLRDYERKQGKLILIDGGKE